MKLKVNLLAAFLLLSFFQKGNAQCANYGKISQNNNGSHGANFLLGQKYTLPAGTLDSLGVNVTSAGNFITMAVYSDASGVPGTLLTQSASTALVSGNNVINVPNITISAGDYWIMKVLNVSTNLYGLSSTINTRYISFSYGTSLPSTFPSAHTSYSSALRFDIWAVICGSPAPEINLKGNTVSIVDGDITPSLTDSTNFGGVPSGTKRRFTIENTGTATLTISGSSVTGTNASEFVISGMPSSITAGSSASFYVTFTSSSSGARNATINITNNDADEGTYNFDITAALPAGALNFDGVDDVVNGTNANLPLGNNARTLEAWYKGNDASGSIINWGNTTTSQRSGLIMIGGKLYFVGENNDFNTNYTINDNVWHHLAFTWDGTTIIGYVDGSEVGRTALSALNTTGTNFRLGTRMPSLNGEQLLGSIDEVRVWNYMRTCAQIRSTMNRQLVGNETGLVMYFDFNQNGDAGNNTGQTTLIDRSGSVANGTLSNFALTGTASNWLISGNGVNGTTPEGQPRIKVKGNGVNIAYNASLLTSADSTDFGTIPGAIKRRFRIINTGNGTLNISSITSTGSHGNNYTITNIPSSIAAGDSAIFYITFNPSATGLRSATITINTNDCIESSFPFSIQGTAIAAEALRFDGINDYVNSGDANLGTGDFTIATWVYVTNNTHSYIVSNRTVEGGATGNWFSLAAGSSGKFVWETGEASTGCGCSKVTVSKTSISSNQWQHIAIVRQGTKMYMFINGNLDTTWTQSSIENFTKPVAGNRAIRIGGWPNNALYFYKGMIHELNIWSAARTCSEIKSTMNHFLVGNEANLIRYYKFNQGVYNGNNTGLAGSSNITTVNDNQTNIAVTNGVFNTFATTGDVSNWSGPNSGISGTTPDPQTEINVKGNTVNIVDGDITPSTADHTDFGLQPLNGAYKTFTIENTGGATLSISSITVSGANASDFSIQGAPSSISAGSSATFKVVFNSATYTVRNAKINITNTDCDEGVYDFAVSAQRYICPKATNADPDTITNLNSDSSWVNCLNWNSESLPDSLTDVAIMAGQIIMIKPGQKARCHNLYLASGAKLFMSGGELHVFGSISAANLVNAIRLDSGKIVFTGTDTNKVKGTFCRFFNVDINKPSGIVLLENGGFETYGYLNFIKGIVRSSAGESVEIMSGASCSEGNPTSFAGCAVRKYGTPSNFVFPTGKGNRWARIALNNKTGGTSWIAEYFLQMYSDTSALNPLSRISAKEYWELSPDGPSTADVKLYWEDAAWSGIDLTQSAANLRVAHYDGTDWEDAGNSSIGFTSAGNIISNSFNNFSPFTFGSTSPLIPLNSKVVLTGKLLPNNAVLINWNITNLRNINKVVLEKKSTTNTNFLEIFNSNTANSYTDNNFTENSFYRLKITTSNGDIIYSNIVLINTTNNAGVSIIPNPVKTNFEITSTNNSIIKNIVIFDVSGKQILDKNCNSSSIVINSILSAGIYTAQITLEDGRIEKLLFIKD